ncbi:hypothetical protein AALP_AA1G119200 [Arabis alpina]|uniref:Sulfotransferase n=1 Tax=Arabis alpina TaxID=50452 RepID=A0A087HMN3_ARAAL|nr:hypothetical protein AALP_AA1G119200 [Arabis alpina]
MSKKELPPPLGENYLSEESKTLISSLLSYQDFVGKLCNYQGCWYFYNTLQGVINFQKNFKPQDTDIILASFPKSGTTWLKALTIALLERSKKNDRSCDHHPLESDNPHGLVPFLELSLYLQSSTPDLTNLSSSSPRVFSTHMPLHTLQVPLKDSLCKVVYVCRNLKDVLVSNWHFKCTTLKNTKVEGSFTLESMFDSFCSGVDFFGPFWENVLSYWRGSLEDPEHVLFMTYEDLKAEPRGQIKRLAEFLGCPFSEQEEGSGGVDKILELCSLRNLTSLEINKSGKTSNKVCNSSFFRKGEVGDWKNHLIPEMENKIDNIVEEKFKGSGLKF